MKGFIVFQNTTGQLLYSKNYNSYPYTTSQDPVLEQTRNRGVSSGASSMSKSSIKKSDNSLNESKILNQPRPSGSESKKFSKESIDY